MGWRPNLLTVEAKSDGRAQEITSQLAQLGFKVIENEDDAYAGMLNLSKNPEAVQSKIASFDISRRRWDEQIMPAIFGLCAVGLLFSGSRGDDPRNSPFVTIPLGILSAGMFLWQAPQIWGWRLELSPNELRIRRLFRWTAVPWDQITAVDSTSRSGRQQESVVLRLSPHSKEILGTFNAAFAHNLRDRLRYELEQRRT